MSRFPGHTPLSGESTERGEIMAMLEEKEIRAFQLRNRTYVCPVCATDEEKDDTETRMITEDVIHDSGPLECVRCKKKVK